jgi:hypothetical protein
MLEHQAAATPGICGLSRLTNLFVIESNEGLPLKFETVKVSSSTYNYTHFIFPFQNAAIGCNGHFYLSVAT